MDVSAFFAPPDIMTARRALCIQPHADDNEIRMGGTIAALAAIVVAVAVYGVLVVALRCLSREDLSLMPKGDKIARLLHIN